MLAGRPCGIKPDMITTAAEADSKVKALKAIEQLGFVGLTEQWPLSVCLFHMRFGGNCLRASFTNVRPGNHTHEYDHFYGLLDFDIGIDQAIYDAASQRFWREVDENDVSLVRCRQDICPGAAEYFQERVGPYYINGRLDHGGCTHNASVPLPLLPLLLLLTFVLDQRDCRAPIP
jgi:hypothetical protein